MEFIRGVLKGILFFYVEVIAIAFLVFGIQMFLDFTYWPMLICGVSSIVIFICLTTIVLEKCDIFHKE